MDLLNPLFFIYDQSKLVLRAVLTYKVGHKRIFLFTNEDNPNSEDQHVRTQSIQRAKDLAELGIDIELFSMNKPGEMFDPMKFYVVRRHCGSPLT